MGQASRALAQGSTRKAAQLSDALVKAGPNGKKITEAYLKTTPVKNRNANDLSAFFISNGADIDSLLNSSNKLIREAAEVAKGRKAFAAGAAVGGAAGTIEEQ